MSEPTLTSFGSSPIHAFLPNHMEDKAAVDAQLNDLIERQGDERIAPIMRRALFPGRRLRPVLFQLLQRQLRVATERNERTRDSQFVPIATSIELAHRASIVVDDLVDHDEVRRQTPTFHAVHGESTTILVSHLLVAEAFLQLRSVKSHWTANSVYSFASAYRAMSIAELGDIGALRVESGRATEFYEHTILPKTSALFGFLFSMAGEVAGVTDDDTLFLSSLGREVGSLYQVYNDIYDDFYAAPQERHSSRAGFSFSLSTALILQHGPSEDRALAKRLLKHNLPQAERSSIRNALDRTAYVDLALNYARERRRSLNAQLDTAARLGVVDTVLSFTEWLRQWKCWSQTTLDDAGY